MQKESESSFNIKKSLIFMLDFVPAFSAI